MELSTCSKYIRRTQKDHTMTFKFRLIKEHYNLKKYLDEIFKNEHQLYAFNILI